MNFKDLLIDSAIEAGLEVLKELGQQRKNPKTPKPKRNRIKKKPGKK